MSAFDAHPLTRCVVGRGVHKTARCTAKMWTSLANPATVPIEIDHFLPLMKKKQSDVVVVEPVSVDSRTDEPDDDVTPQWSVPWR